MDLKDKQWEIIKLLLPKPARQARSFKSFSWRS